MEKRSIGPVTGAASIGAALGVIIVWLGTLSGIDIPPGVEGAIVVILTALGGWFIRPGNGRKRH